MHSRCGGSSGKGGPKAGDIVKVVDRHLAWSGGFLPILLRLATLPRHINNELYPGAHDRQKVRAVQPALLPLRHLKQRVRQLQAQ